MQTDDAGSTTAEYDYGSDRLLAMTHVTEGRRFYLFDGLGSVTNLLKPDGSLAARYQYDAWGNYSATAIGTEGILEGAGGLSDLLEASVQEQSLATGIVGESAGPAGLLKATRTASERADVPLNGARGSGPAPGFLKVSDA